MSQAQSLLTERAYDAALSQVREIRKLHPAEPRAAFVAGAAKRGLGDHVGALRELQPLARQMPEAAPVHLELALVLRATGAFEGAIDALRTAVALDAKLSRGWQTLGELLSDRGEVEAADDAFRHQMATASLHPGLMKAVQLVAEGKLGMAEGICRDYLYRFPADVNAIRLLADIGLQLEIFDDAAKLLKRCLELAPDYHLARNNYAQALSKASRFEAALEELAYLETVEPENLAHPILTASVLVNIGDYAGAIERYERILKRLPTHAHLQMSYGHALKTVGRQAESIAAYRRAIAAEPKLGEAYWSLANLKTFRFSEDEILEMRRLTGEPLQARDEFHVCFAAGKALEDTEQYADAFEFYARGNALKRSQSAYDADVNTQLLADIATSCVKARFDARAGFGHPAPDPIFIVGLPRSGSTLLEQILASHSAVDGTMELPNILQFVRRLAGKKNKDDPSQYPDALWNLDASACAALGREFLDVTQVQRRGAPFFIDKMPNNYAHVGLIHLILPNAKIIDARRHPLGTCFSGFKQLFAAGQEFTYDLVDIGRYYHDYVQLMDHWDAVLPGRVLRVDYERVIEDIETEVRRVLDYCELTFEPACLAFYANDRAVRTASSEQVRQPIYRDAVEQWRHFDDHLEPLKRALGGVLDR